MEEIQSISVLPGNGLMAVYENSSGVLYKVPVIGIACVHRNGPKHHVVDFEIITVNNINSGYMAVNSESHLNQELGLFRTPKLKGLLNPDGSAVKLSQHEIDSLGL